MIATPARVGVASAAVVLAVSGCAGRSMDDAARGAEAFHTALDRGDGSAACARLSPTTRSTLAESAGKPCRVAVLEEQVSRPGDVENEAECGTSAQVRYAHDTLFLGRFDGHWRLTAAGCTRRPDRPHDCVIEGG